MNSSKEFPIVSSSHLAKGDALALSELEFGLIIAHNAFQRWVSHCMGASGNRDLSFTDILVLHNINHRDRAKRLADICFTLNIEDSHTVSYALKKLHRAKLVVGDKTGKEIFYSTTDEGKNLCKQYAEIRRNCLLGSQLSGIEYERLSELAGVLRGLSGLYDQAGRAAASL